MSDVDPQEFGHMRGQIESLSATLGKHLSDCYEVNKQVAANLNRLTLAVAVLALAVFGSESVATILARIF